MPFFMESLKKYQSLKELKLIILCDKNLKIILFMDFRV